METPTADNSSCHTDSAGGQIHPGCSSTAIPPVPPCLRPVKVERTDGLGMCRGFGSNRSCRAKWCGDRVAWVCVRFLTLQLMEVERWPPATLKRRKKQQNIYAVEMESYIPFCLESLFPRPYV